MGLRSRLLALIALALLPAFGLMYFISHIEHDAVRAEAERYALTLTQKEAVNQLKTIYEARTALSILARIPEIAQSADVCTGFLRRYVDQTPHLANIGIIQSNGHLLCSAVSLYGHDPDISTLPYFRQRVPRPRFILSDRIVAPLNGRRTLVATYPVLDAHGTAQHILFATLPLDWFTTAASLARLPTGAFFSLLDANGHVLAHYPDSARLIPHEQILLHNIQPHTRTAASWAGRTQIDGHEWAITSTGLNTRALGHGLHVIVAIPMTSSLQDADSTLYWNFGVLSTFALITLILAWYGGNLLILRPIQRLAKAADMIASGRYSVRAHILAGPREITALGDAFDNMAGALEERMRQDEIQKQRIARLNRIYHMLSAINGAIIRIRDRDQLLNEACRIVVELGHLQFAWIGLIEPGRDVLRIAALAGNAEAFVRTIRVTLDPGQPEGQGLVGEAIRAGECKFSNQVSEDPRLDKWREGLDDAGIQSAAAFPLKVHGLTVGALALYISEPDFFDEQELTLLNELAADTALGLEHIEKDQQISFLANRDTLTRLPNRNLFEDRLRQELRRFHHNTVQMAVLAISVINYPRINDSKGRAIGDQVLLAVAARLEALDLSDETQGLLKDRVARLGNHDFCLIVSDAADPAYIAALSEKIQATLSESVKTEREAVDLDVRIGAALYPRDARQADDLIHHALFAAHIQTAVSPHSRIAFYSAQEDTAAQNRDALEADLRIAIERQEFYLEYQPRVNAKTGTISSVEALIRWDRPGHGLVSPNEFIPVLEDTGLIVPVGEWVARTALMQRLSMQHTVPDSFVISVNVSSQELHTANYVNRIRALLEETGAHPDWLEIEITESGLVENGNTTLEQFFSLKSLGLKLSIDDFGTGYSSLSYLRQFPVDTLKIDQAFVREISHAQDALLIVKSIIGLAKALNLIVVAEGVETDGQKIILTKEGCDELQGYYFSRPLKAVALEELFIT